MSIEPVPSQHISLGNLCPNLVANEIEHSIQQCKHWQHVAQMTKKVALGAIAAALVLSALFFSSPALPIIAAFTLICFAMYEGTQHYGAFNGVAFFITASTTFSLKLGQYVYSSEVIRIVLIANGIIACPCLLVFFTGELVDLFFEKKTEWLTELKTELHKMHTDPTYTPQENSCQKLLPLYKDLYAKQFSKGFLHALPAKIEQQLTLLCNRLS